MRQSNVIKLENEPSILRHSNVVLSEGLQPLRIVLCDLGNKFVTWNELLVIRAATREGVYSESEIIELTCSHLGFDQGNYFEFRPDGHTGFHNRPTKEVALAEAVEDFNMRCARRGIR